MEKAGDVEAKVNLQPPFYVRNIDARCPKGHCPLAKKTRRTPTGSLRMRPPRTKIRLSLTAPPPPLISLRPRLPRKTSIVVGEAMEAIQPLGSMLPK